MQPRAKARPFIPSCGFAHLDGLGFLDLEWAEPPVKLSRGWRNRQLKRAARIAKEIAELDRRILAADSERARIIGLEIQRDLQIEAEKDSRLQELNRQYADLQADAEVTAKYVAQVMAAMGRAVRREEKKLRRDIERDQATIRACLKKRFRPETCVTLDQLM